MGGVLGGGVGFVGGIIIMPAVIFFGHTVSTIERRVQPSLNKVPPPNTIKHDSDIGPDK